MDRPLLNACGMALGVFALLIAGSACTEGLQRRDDIEPTGQVNVSVSEQVLIGDLAEH